nr:MAG TPA: hypothetical protein [Caudoviricetes sp.]
MKLIIRNNKLMAELPNLFDSLLEDNKTTTTEQVGEINNKKQ